MTIPSPAMSLLDTCVHVWNVSLLASPDALREMSALLSKEETARAAMFRFDKHRNAYIIAHGALHSVLARYLAVEPQTLHFTTGKNGKPELADASRAWLRFNISHSHERCLIAVARDREVGVDIEWIHRNVSADKLAKRFFAPTEAAIFENMADRPEHVRLQSFFNCWTRKEAFIKAIGEGLSFPLDKFVVSFLPDEPCALLDVAQEPQLAFHWSLHALDAKPDYAAALAVAGENIEISAMDFALKSR